MRSIMTGAVLLGILALPAHAASAASAGSLDTTEIEKLTGLKGTLDDKGARLQGLGSAEGSQSHLVGRATDAADGASRLGPPSSAPAARQWSWATWCWRRVKSIR